MAATFAGIRAGMSAAWAEIKDAGPASTAAPMTVAKMNFMALTPLATTPFNACSRKKGVTAKPQRPGIEGLLRRLSGGVLAELRHYVLGQKAHAVAFPGFVRAAPVETDLQQRAERTDALAQRHE